MNSALGAEGRGFESLRPDHSNFSLSFILPTGPLLGTAFHLERFAVIVMPSSAAMAFRFACLRIRPEPLRLARLSRAAIDLFAPSQSGHEPESRRRRA